MGPCSPYENRKKKEGKRASGDRLGAPIAKKENVIRPFSARVKPYGIDRERDAEESYTDVQT